MSNSNPGLIGKAIRIKGELHGEEDLVIEGKVEGTIALKKNHLILERSAVITDRADDAAGRRRSHRRERLSARRSLRAADGREDAHRRAFRRQG